MTSPLLCSAEEKAPLEARNSVDQLDLVTSWIQRGDRLMRESHLLELQRLAVADIYPCGGDFRSARFKLEISDGAHVPPDANSIKGHIVDLLEWVNDPSNEGLERAAMMLWRTNWIHPFNGGNGRTARAAAYFLLASALGFMPPGEPSLPGLLQNDRDGYIDALRQCDALYEGELTTEVIGPMADLVARLFEQQLLSATRRLKK